MTAASFAEGHEDARNLADALNPGPIASPRQCVEVINSRVTTAREAPIYPFSD
jgi:hypothetical protein